MANFELTPEMAFDVFVHGGVSDNVGYPMNPSDNPLTHAFRRAVEVGEDEDVKIFPDRWEIFNDRTGQVVKSGTLPHWAWRFNLVSKDYEWVQACQAAHLLIYALDGKYRLSA